MVVAGVLFRGVDLADRCSIEEAERNEARRLLKQYGDALTVEEVRAEMGEI